MSAAIKTPKYNLKQFPEVYEPSEDTFLLLDALEDELPWLQLQKPLLLAEIGSGSGVNITALSNALNSQVGFATDINIDACSATVSTALLNHVQIECCNMDFMSLFRDNIFDVILFNPPYVPTHSQEINGLGIERSWAGGADGRVIIDKFCQKLPYYLSKCGVCYLLLLKDNNIGEIFHVLSKLSFTCEVIKERKILGEHLFVIKIFKSQ